MLCGRKQSGLKSITGCKGGYLKATAREAGPQIFPRSLAAIHALSGGVTLQYHARHGETVFAA